ncbi:hypothetical protein BRM3_14975 (plasmid) [Brachybacterium huguangmaarense]|uniref:Lipoprotein n=1 Tax=Brachybacterium huguangmaarense TaxID=1652028 RepID=A0ABY6G4Z9_9MICO|nr:hypothetical protein [Brachybacterium huguangmaarense]UYG18303.1 hypothetical protein BRM3_14975 [Brachybacterium huguangmaarense]
MIRRALTPLLAAVALVTMIAACDTGPSPEDTATKFMKVYVEGDEAAACELADREIGDCTTRPTNELVEGPAVGDTFENEDTGSTAVVVTYTTAARSDEPYTYLVEVKKDGKVTAWEDITGQPANRETAVMVLGWSK